MRNWKEICVTLDTPIIKVMEIIDRSATQIALVVDNQLKLEGTVTDGDIRRGILSGISLNEPIKLVMNASPISINKYDNDMKIRALFKARKQLPVVNEHMQVVGLKFADEFFTENQKDNWVVLMAGGLGTRLRPLTDDVPKPLLTVGSKPILETIMESFIEHGFNKFFLSVNYKKELIKGYFGDGSKWGVTIKYIDEGKRLGTAGALSLIDEIISRPVIVMNGDILTKVNFQQLLDFHEEHESLATMCVREYNYQVPYGVITSRGHQLLSIEEKPTQRYFVNAGIYVLNPETFRFIPRNQFYDMPTLFESVLSRGFQTSVFPIHEYWLDIGQMNDFEKANIEYSEVFQ